MAKPANRIDPRVFGNKQAAQGTAGSYREQPGRPLSIRRRVGRLPVTPGITRGAVQPLAAFEPKRSSRQRPREQDVVLQVNVLVQRSFQGGQAVP